MAGKLYPSSAAALADLPDGAVVLVGGFGGTGLPENLLVALAEHGARELTIVSNHCGQGEGGLARLLRQGQVRKMVASYPFHRGSYVFRELYLAGKVELEQVPQGTLAERLRAAGAGIPAFYTPTGAGTVVAEGKEVRAFDGREHLLEYALPGDYALIRARRADPAGGLTYRGTGRNFNPVMATAARITVAEVEEVVEVGALDPEEVVTPGIYVDRVVVGEDLGLRSE
ncbi:MAG: 3-oxoacid CoA-transferase subunit A [Nitrospinota bacterium]